MEESSVVGVESKDTLPITAPKLTNVSCAIVMNTSSMIATTYTNTAKRDASVGYPTTTHKWPTNHVV